MSYTPPAGDSITATWEGEPAYTPPAGDAVTASWAPESYTASGAVTATPAATGVATHGVSAQGATSTQPTATGGATHESIAVEASGAPTVPAPTATGAAAHGVAGTGTASTSASATGQAGHGVSAQGTAATPQPAATGQADVGVAGSGAAAAAPTADGQALVERYELRGEVRSEDGVLLDRTVRAHRLDTGAVVAEAVTDGGRFRLHVGFTALECYTLALDMSPDASDTTPPVANHVIAELADDAA